MMYVSGFAWTGFLHLASVLRKQSQATIDQLTNWKSYAIALCGCVLSISCLGIAMQNQSWQYTPQLYCIAGISFSLAYFLAAVLSSHINAHKSSLIIWIVICGLVMRFILLVGMPASDDLNRYVLEGQQVARGQNPYLHAPQDPKTIALISAHVDPATCHKAAKRSAATKTNHASNMELDQTLGIKSRNRRKITLLLLIFT